MLPKRERDQSVMMAWPQSCDDTKPTRLVCLNEAILKTALTITKIYNCNDYKFFVVFRAVCLSRGVVSFTGDLMLELAAGAIWRQPYQLWGNINATILSEQLILTVACEFICGHLIPNFVYVAHLHFSLFPSPVAVSQQLFPHMLIILSSFQPKRYMTPNGYYVNR